jgi:hypothetical protein
MASNIFLGSIEIADSSQRVTIAMDGNQGNIILGGGGHDGDLLMKNTAGSITVGINGQNGSVLLGGSGQDGDLVLRNSSNRDTMRLDGAGAAAYFGGNGSDGDLVIRDASGGTTIHLDGQSGEVRIRDWRIRVPDDVFEPNYPLRSPADLRAFIKACGHLPDIPSAQDVADNGLDLAGLGISLLRKVEELTLYVLRQDQILAEQDRRIATLEAELAATIRSRGGSPC